MADRNGRECWWRRMQLFIVSMFPFFPILQFEISYVVNSFLGHFAQYDQLIVCYDTKKV